MKKQNKFSILYSILILAGLILISSCGDEKLKQEITNLQKQVAEQTTEIEELKNQLGLNGEVERPNNIISYKQADTLYTNYTKRASQIDEIVINEGGPKNFSATRSLFYNIDSLYNYLAYVRTKSREAKIQPSGIKFYFGIYPKDYDRYDRQYARRTTFFIAPTKKVTDNQGNVKHLGYTLGDDLEEILLDDRLGQNKIDPDYKKAGLFDISSILPQGDNSLIGNEFPSTPPKD